MIKAKAVEFSYPGGEGEVFPALNGLELVVGEGEYIALLGPNGSGKTTLLKLFNALLAPSRGEVLVGGLSTSVAENLPRVRRTCGMIFQNPDNQLVATTVEEDLAFGPENLALPPGEIRERVHRVADQLGLESLLKKPPHLLSGGQKQKVAIGGILAMEPRCLLMDEPTAMLDPAGRREVIETVVRLNREKGLTVVHVTHVPEEAVHADRVLLLNRGRLIGQGDPGEILTDLSLLHSLDLQGTAAAELAALLREDGFPLPPRLLNSRELVESLCSWARNH